MHRSTPMVSHRIGLKDERSTNEPRVLDVIPTGNSTERMVIQQQFDAAGPQLVLVQESFAANVGWFPQSRVVIQADQLAAFKALFSGRAVSKLVQQHVAFDANDCEHAVFAFPQAS